MEVNQSAYVGPVPDKGVMPVRYANSKFPRTLRVPLSIFLGLALGIIPGFPHTRLQGLSRVSRSAKFALEPLHLRLVGGLRLPLLIFQEFHSLRVRVILS